MKRQRRDGRHADITIGNRIAPLRFIVFFMLLPLGWFAHLAMWPTDGWMDAATTAFDVAALAFLLSLAPLLKDSGAASMRRHAMENDANRVLILLITTIVTLVVMTAVYGELIDTRQHHVPATFKLVGTLVLIWLFANTVYALHYAHEWYSRAPQTGDDMRGLEFPATAAPAYGDFFYFAFTLGMTFQTSDVTITAPRIRQIVLLHSLAAFVFNIGVIAFTINVLGASS